MKVANLSLWQWAFIAIGFVILSLAAPVFAIGVCVGVIGGLLLYREVVKISEPIYQSPIVPAPETTRLEKRTLVSTEIRVPVFSKMCAYCKSVIEGPVSKCPNCGAPLT